MTEGKLRSGSHVVARTLVAALVGVLPGAALNAALGE